jgi:alkanesulfonate monooxygenase SsuD/methylene tetrahydromethanopterin reductase-like flavin-dependent oxidoreductase (luciferase family)
MKWSVLDQSPTSAGSGQDSAIRESIALAKHCDELGYERFWVSEHHNSGSVVGTSPQLWILGSSAYGAQLAAHFGLPYAYAYFFTDGADTEEQAQRQAASRDYWRAGFEKGLRLPLVSPEAALAHAYTPAEQATIAASREKALVETAAQVADKLGTPARRLALEEIVINTWTFDPAVRRHSYALLARVFGL